MGCNPDYRDLFVAFNDAEARFLIVGAYAVIHHTEPRYTKDIDVWVEPSPANATRVFRALAAFGAPLVGVGAADFTDPAVVYQVGIEPNRIDVLTSIGPLDFNASWSRASQVDYGGVAVRVLSLDDILAAKRAAGRPQDLLDIEKLERARKRLET